MMSHVSDPEKIPTACPQCGKRFLAPAIHVGKQARCPACAQVFVIALAETGIRGAEGPGQGSSRAAEGVCAICQCPIAPNETTTVCPECKSPFHQDCWEYNHGCAVYGCPQAPPTEGLSALEIPAAYWGQENKPCPKCGKEILAAAVRCRHCGATFDSATPQERGAFQAQEQVKARLPAVRMASVWLLIFSLVPCVAPIVAVVGTIWYLSNRETIRALPALHLALCRIALGVSIVVSMMLALFVVLKTALGV